MCGIVGLVDRGGLNQAAARRDMKLAFERLRPRGPDGEGRYFDKRCALGHRRLAIVDLSKAGAQPMTRGPLVITYNGFIYNFQDLREKLRATGVRFKSESDTEVLLAGWQKWGQKLLPRLIGMFAFAIWNKDTGELILARDRFGQKPLHYKWNGGRLSFSSDLFALQKLEGTNGEIDPASLRLYFALRYLPEPRSILRGVGKLAPGHLLRFTGKKIEIKRWYDLARSRPEPYYSEEDAADDLRERVDEAVRDRLVADVPVGAFLSGGVDSAIVVSAMSRASAKVRTFTVGFEDAPSYYEERPEAHHVADVFGTKHTEISVSAAKSHKAVNAVFDALDEPFGDSSAIPTYLIARETRKHVTVALSGDGADEIFGGYRKYLGELQAARYQLLPRWFRRGAIEPLARLLPESKDKPVLEQMRRFRRFVEHGGKDAVGRQAGWARSLSEKELDGLLLDHHPAPSIEDIVEGLRAEADGDDPINAMLAADIGLVLPGDMLVKVDRASMANGLEVRSPFLDQRVVECAAAMPGAFKLAGGIGKRVLRLAYSDELPAKIYRRPKKGFEVPIAEWLCGPLSSLVKRSIDPVRLQKQGLFNPDLPARWLALLEAGKQDTSWKLWSLIAFQAWWDRQTEGS